LQDASKTTAYKKDETRNQCVSNDDSGVAGAHSQQRFAYLILILKF
jgi:hypothetical protein